MAHNDGVTISAYQFFKTFPNEQAAVEYLERRRWSAGVICPYCSSDRTARQRTFQYHQCKDCRRKFTVRTGTIFERSHISLDKWLYAMYLLQTARKGVSSLQLSKELGITQKASWFLLHRLREACQIEAHPKMSGAVEVDETYIGGKERNKHEFKKLHSGRGAVGKQAILGIRQRGGAVMAKPIDSTDAATLQREIVENVAEGSMVFTDEHASYTQLWHSYRHATVKHSVKEFVNGMAHTNGIESVWAVLKRGYTGVYHQWSAKHTARYINEFTFRLNDGNVKRPTMARLDSLIDGTMGKRLQYRDLVA